VINASPHNLSTSAWLEQHNLIDSQPVDSVED